MDRIQTQASKLWDILFDEETAQTYQNALSLTGDILKESAQLIWLVLCSFFVFGAWFGDASMKTGKGVRDWVDKKDAILPNPDTPKVSASQKGKSLLESSRESAANLLAKAREELGLDPNAPLAAPREDSPVAKLVTPAEETASRQPAATASSTAPSSTTTSSPADEPSATTDSAPADSSPAAGAATARPATSEGQNIGSSRASSRGSGSSGIGFGNPYGGRSSGSQSGGSQSSKYDNQDFDDDPGDEDDVDDSSWPPHSEDD